MTRQRKSKAFMLGETIGHILAMITVVGIPLLILWGLWNLFT